MYYVEKLIDGKLYYKNSLRGYWMGFSVEMLNKRIVDLEKSLLDLHKESSKCEVQNKQTKSITNA